MLRFSLQNAFLVHEKLCTVPNEKKGDFRIIN